MKHLLSIALFTLLFSSQLSAQEVPEIQTPLVTKIAATWCPPCGGWSWDLFEEIVQDNQEKATLIVAHHSGDLVNDVAKDFSENLEAPYQPYIYFNNEDQGATSSNTSTIRTGIQEKINDESLESPIANAGMNLSLDNDELTVDTRTLFFQEVEGEFYLGVYIVENEVVNFQANQGPDAIHEKILRGAISTGSFGELLVNGNISSGTEFTHNFTGIINSNWNIDHLEIITIIWEKVNDRFQVVNSNISTNFETTSANQMTSLNDASIDINPTILQSSSTVEIHVQNEMKNAQVSIIDSKGAVVSTLFNGRISSGTHKYILDKNVLNGQGTYYVVLQNNRKILSSPFIFQQ